MNKLAQFLKSGFKSLKRERYYALLNILGLGLGIFCFLLTSLYVKDELTHDKWHKNAENIYMPQQIFESEQGSMMLMPSFAIGQGWVDEIPAVRDYVNISSEKHRDYIINESEFKTKQLVFTTGALFRIFDFSLALGNPEKALSEPDAMVISHEIARKHFKGENPLGEYIEVKGIGTYKVTGVLNPIPSNSHLQFEFLVPIDFTKDPYTGLENNWQFGSGYHYLLIDEGSDMEKLSDETLAMLEKHTGNKQAMPFRFNKFSELYMSGSAMRTGDSMFGGRKKYVVIFSIIGALMLLVASFNYINLTTSRSFARAKDFAIRKVIGASKARLIAIQLGETFFIALLGLVIALIALELTLPSINELIGKNLSLQIQRDPSVLFLPASVLVLVMLLSGLYPALIGSRFNLSASLKGKSPNSRGTVIRKALIVIQFTICTGVLASALIIRFQANHMINMDLGYNTKNIISIEMRRSGLYDKMQTFKNEVQRSAIVEGIASGPIPTSGGAMIINIGEEDKVQQFFGYSAADKNFINIADLQIVAGNSFANVDESALANGVIINEAACELLDLSPEEAISTKIPDSEMEIVGVIKNYHTSSTKSKIGPQIISYDEDQLSNVLIRYKAGDQDKVVAHAEAVLAELGYTEQLKYNVIENHFENAFKREEALISIFDGLTIMLISVAGLGLFALAVFESQIREKELCIRKVLGANSLTLLRNLNMRFVLLIGLALIISIPITQYLIGSWLDAFPYRIDSTANYFILAGGVVMVLAIVMLSIQGVNSVRKNPAEVLRSE
ncbi:MULTISPECIES: ABC transporter permease [Roseivirga]|uniref:ABC3 transporter permease protein domain-containing protein n=1 Tax=Roseivirga spongicola TaxID=333140 RepID=A0A150X4E1_9BACT|nr:MULTISPECIES: ABC transporter permease [Roseivirga]KYG73567.1 hypothetical protein AWW68_12820 [Roseivirga spongicola]MBO6659836.1 ABC transporter permease [Roseivirga sp.]MBO6907427.1 ABC transporter permease [Roseivirga sp.]WPZ09803.1 ABC transporter permease [Roseivirga spongicola]